MKRFLMVIFYFLTQKIGMNEGEFADKNLYDKKLSRKLIHWMNLLRAYRSWLRVFVTNKETYRC